MTHEEAWDQIPWLANASLRPASARRLEEHLARCAACREELRLQRTLVQFIQEGPRVEAMPPASLQKLWRRIDAEPAAPHAMPAPHPLARALTGRYRMAAVALLSLLAGVALTQFLQQQDTAPAPYRAVTDATTAAPGALRVVFAPEMTVGQLQALLDRTGLHIVAGPSPSGVYTLAGSDAMDRLEVLRTDPRVRFAEPVMP